MRFTRAAMVVGVLCLPLLSQPAEDACLRQGLRWFAAPSAGTPLEGSFTLLEWPVPPVLPARADVPLEVRFARTGGDSALMVSAAVVGDWDKSAVWPLALGAKARPGDTLGGVVTIRCPKTPGQYRLRLLLRQLPRRQRDLPFTFGGCCEGCVWSEVAVTVVDLDAPARAQPVPESGPAQAQAQPAPQHQPRPQSTGKDLPQEFRTSQRALLDSMKAAGTISEQDYRMKMEYLGH